MDKTTQKRRLFNEFDPVSKEEWIEVIKSDLKGKDFTETLVRLLEDEIQIGPVYHREDTTNKALFQSSHLGNRWRKRQDFTVADWETVRQKVADIRTHEFDAIGLRLDFDFAENVLADFLSENASDDICIYLASEKDEDSLVEAVTRLPDEVLAKWKGGLDLNLQHVHSHLGKVVEIEKRARSANHSYSVLHVNGVPNTDSVIEEMGEMLARVAAVCEAGLEGGLTCDQIREHLRITVSASKDYFTTIAKIRALRMLIANVLLLYVPELADADQFTMIAVNSDKGESADNPYKNLLSHTTQALSALSAGVDELSLDTTDSDGDRDHSFFERLNRNIQWLLATESHLTLVADPLGGSYYIETLTNELAEKAWANFQKKMA